jgi:hypothetical protein
MSSIRNASSFVCFALAVSLAACGGSDGDSGTTDQDTGTGADTSGSDGTTTDTAKSDSPGTDGTTTDTLTPPTDGAKTDTATPGGDASGIACGAATCKAGEVCCVTPKDGGADQACAASCADGGVTLGCDGPEDCSGGTAKICCATLKVGAGTPPACPFESGAASCAADCPTRIPTSCPGEGKARLCHTKSDCAGDASNPECCTFSGGGGTATFCVSSVIAGFATSCAP